MSKVFLNGHIDVPTDRLLDVRAALPDHIRLTKAETGCISFDVTPDPKIEGRFNVSECFIDQAAFDAHQDRAKNSPWADITQGIPRDYTITKSGG